MLSSIVQKFGLYDELHGVGYQLRYEGIFIHLHKLFKPWLHRYRRRRKRLSVIVAKEVAWLQHAYKPFKSCQKLIKE